jgi:hypothetical protein
MAQFSAPFDGSPIATQAQWSRMARRWGIDGVHAEEYGSPALKVTGSGAATVAVAVGEAFVNGFYYKNDAVLNLGVAPNAGTSARVDMVVLRCDMSENEVIAAYKTGGSVAPTLDSDEGGIYEIPLAQCTVAAGSSVVTAANVQDRRWFTDRGAVPSVPGGRRPSIKSQLLVEGTSLYVGDGVDWKWLASGGAEEITWTPVWTAGGTAINWGTGAVNIGRLQVMGKRAHLTIHLAPTVNPANIDQPLQVSLPPAYPATAAHRSLLPWIYTEKFPVAGRFGVQGMALILPDESTTKISSFRYPTADGNGADAPVNIQTLKNGAPYEMRPGSELTIDGSLWLA